MQCNLHWYQPWQLNAPSNCHPPNGPRCRLMLFNGTELCRLVHMKRKLHGNAALCNASVSRRKLSPSWVGFIRFPEDGWFRLEDGPVGRSTEIAKQMMDEMRWMVRVLAYSWSNDGYTPYINRLTSLISLLDQLLTSCMSLSQSPESVQLVLLFWVRPWSGLD